MLLFITQFFFLLDFLKEKIKKNNFKGIKCDVKMLNFQFDRRHNNLDSDM